MPPRKDTPEVYQATRFRDLFDGLRRAHGYYQVIPPKTPGEKSEGRAITERTEPSIGKWLEHLAGSYGLGVVPIRDDGTAGFGAIDIDRYDLDLKALNAKVQGFKIPAVVCRTKSGGAHVYLFCGTLVPAALVRERLMEWSIALGFAGVEIFPKQSNITPNDTGNWINMPYFDGAKSVRYALGVDGERLTPEAFLLYAEGMRQSEENLHAFTLPKNNLIDEVLKEGPPCLQSLAMTGFPQGSRNMALFSLAVYLKKRYNEEWAPHLDDLNRRFMSPPLTSAEVQNTVKSANKKDYEYRCLEQPICAVCNKQICLTRKYGVGQGEEDLGVVMGAMSILKTAPPIYIVDVNGARIELQSDELMAQAKFQRRCIEELRIWPASVKTNAWRKIMGDLLGKAEMIDVPADGTDSGQLITHLERYCTQRAQAQSSDELLNGLPWLDKEDGRVYFTSADFIKYLDLQRVRISLQRLVGTLRRLDIDLGHRGFNIKGKYVNTWSVPQFKPQREKFEVPRRQGAPF